MITVTPSLHPDHLADLNKSGLTDETIAALGIYSARPGDIPKLVGWNPPSVQSALVFPYPGSDGFCRVKVFPSYKDRDGHTVKYLQRPKSGVHLYIPPQAAKVLKDPTVPLTWAEGEKKAAKACQEGVACVGLGGLWSWLEEGTPIVHLDDIAHVEREETIFPDSDIWSRPDLLRAVYVFGKELENRGAKASIAIIPPGPNAEKRGIDDDLVDMEQEGIPAQEALAKLKRIPLTHKAFAQAGAWWKGWVARRAAASDPPLDAVRLLERVGQGHRLHPAQDFTGGVLWYGVPAGRDLLLVTSERKLIRADELPDGLQVDNRGFDLCRFSQKGILAFLSGATIQGHHLLRDLEAFF